MTKDDNDDAFDKYMGPLRNRVPRESFKDDDDDGVPTELRIHGSLRMGCGF